MPKFFWQKNKTASHTGQIGISLSQDGLAFACVEQDAQAKHLTHQGHISGPRDEQKTLLKESITQLNLQGMKAQVVLFEKDYQIFLLEQPQVPENEKSKAIRWLIAEHIDFPIEQAVVDYIEVPQKAHRDSVKMLYVVVTKKSKIDETISWINAAGLRVTSIDICQSALRQIALNLENAEEGQALLHLEEEKSHLIIFKNKTLYMMRDLDLGLKMLSAIADDNSTESLSIYQDLSIEIQRSFDYCASNLQSANVSRLVITPLKDKKPQLLSNLSNILGLPVREINYSEFLNIQPQHLSQKDELSAFAIGAALGQDNP